LISGLGLGLEAFGLGLEAFGLGLETPGLVNIPGCKPPPRHVINTIQYNIKTYNHAPYVTQNVIRRHEGDT